MSKRKFVPITPGGTICMWLKSGTENAAWDKLLKETGGIYKTKAALVKRGYTVEQMTI